MNPQDVFAFYISPFDHSRTFIISLQTQIPSGASQRIYMLAVLARVVILETDVNCGEQQCAHLPKCVHI